MTTLPLTLTDWRAAVARPGAARDLIASLRAVCRPDDPAWILLCDDAFVAAQLARIDARPRSEQPLYGIPFAVKDNIDVAGLPTTAACPAYAYRPQRSATVVERLMAAGAVLIGKTNLDQFATGLVGTRSPYGEVPNTFDAAYVSGGSSSGSASVVARGLVPFALGTDTAGSGRVPAGFNNIVGAKPTPGSVSMRGVLPACRSLDVVSVFALTVADAAEVQALIEGVPDDEPRFATTALRPGWLTRGTAALPRVGIPADPGCDAGIGYSYAYDDAVEQWRAWGIEPIAIDMRPLFDVARLLYDGPWVAERHAVVKALLEREPAAIDPVVRQVIEKANEFDGVAAFEGRYALERLRAEIAGLWSRIDVLMVPTAPTCPTRSAVRAAPVERNSELGRYTNFVNLLGWSALAVPSGFADSGLPFGVTFIAPGGSDAALAALGVRWETARALPLGARLCSASEVDRTLRRSPASAPTLKLAVVGAHLEGMPLHGQITERGCRLVERTTTAPRYRLYALPDTVPAKPGLARVADGGTMIEVEVYEMPQEAVGSFLALIAPPLGLGSVELADGRWVKGFICEPAALNGATDISRHGGWRAYLAST